MADFRRAIRAVTAYHEAGHAVVAAALGQDVYWIEVGERSGRTCHRPRGEDPAADDPLAIVLAGDCAEAMAVRRDLAGTPQLSEDCAKADDPGRWLDAVRDCIRFGSDQVTGDSDYWEAARIMSGVVSDSDLEGALHHAGDRAREILDRDWADVKAIADSLAAPRGRTD